MSFLIETPKLDYNIRLAEIIKKSNWKKDDYYFIEAQNCQIWK